MYKIKDKSLQRAITPKLWKVGLWFLGTALPLSVIYLPMKFQVDISYSSRDMVRTKIKYKNLQRAITPKLWKVGLWFLGTALPLSVIYLPMKFQVDISYSSPDMARTKIKYKQLQRAITPKLWKVGLLFLSTALPLSVIYQPMKFQVDISYSSRDMVRTKIKYKNLQRAITLKLWKVGLWFLGTALPLSVIYLPMKFQVDISYSSRDMARTKIKYKTLTWNFNVRKGA